MVRALSGNGDWPWFSLQQVARSLLHFLSARGTAGRVPNMASRILLIKGSPHAIDVPYPASNLVSRPVPYPLAGHESAAASFSRFQVSFVLSDPGALNSCTHTFPETNAGFIAVYTYFYVSGYTMWDPQFDIIWSESMRTDRNLHMMNLLGWLRLGWLKII